MAGNRRRRSRVAWVVVLLVAVVAGFCTLCSIQEKFGYDFGLPSIQLPSVMDALAAFAPDSSQGNTPEPTPTAVRDKLTVHLLDVGQSEAILITAPGKTVLIDSGETDQGENVIRYLRDHGVKAIDLLIATHPHADHIGGMADVIDAFPVTDIVMSDLPDEMVPTTRTFTDLLLAIAGKGLTITPAAPGQTWNLGDGAVLTILGPLGEYADLNDYSVICRVDYGNSSFLFTGDATKAAEADLLAEGILPADVLNVGHHGSSTSSSQAFLDAVSPRIALISCGQDNSYGHPHREVMERLQALDARILRTDLDGTIKIVSDGKTLGIELGTIK